MVSCDDEIPFGARLSDDELPRERAGTASFDADTFLANSYNKLYNDKIREAHELQKEVETKKRRSTVKSFEAEQSPTTLEEIWEHLCSSYGRSPFTLEAWKFVDTIHRCTKIGLSSDLAIVVNGRSSLTLIDLESRDIAYLCFLVLEGHSPEDCVTELLAKMSDSDYAKVKSDDALQHHIDTDLRLQDFKKLIPIIADVLHLGVPYVLAVLVWLEKERLEMPTFLYTEFFMKCNAHRFLHSEASGTLKRTDSDSDNIAFGQLDHNAFVRLCHSLQIVDRRERRGKSWEFCVAFWSHFLKNVDEHVMNYVDRRPVAKFVGDVKVRRKSLTKEREILTGRTELTAMLESFFLSLPTRTYKSPFEMCCTYLLDQDDKKFAVTWPGEETLDGEDKMVTRNLSKTLGPDSASQPDWFRKQRDSLQLEITQLFKAEDHKRIGGLEHADLAALLRTGNPDMLDSEIEILFQGADHNHDGIVDFNEFVEFISSENDPLKISPKHAQNPTDKVKSLRTFAETDMDCNSTLDFEELCALLRRGNPKMTDSEIHKLFDAADVKGIGFINYHEFVDYIWSTANTPKRSLKAREQNLKRRSTATSKAGARQ